MNISWNNLRSFNDIVKDILNVLNKTNVSIYGDFIKDDYIYEYKYDTVMEDFSMRKEKYHDLVSSKGVPYYIEEQYAGIRDFKGSLLYSRSDKDLENVDKEKLVIALMIIAIAHDVYDGEMYAFSEMFKSAWHYIKQYGYDINWHSKCCFPFDIKSKYNKDGGKVVLLEETIIEAICNYTMFEACGKRTLEYSEKYTS